ncbi:MAG: S9 family peptidase [Bacteroidota bacterium]
MKSALVTLCFVLTVTFLHAQSANVLQPIDVFDLEYASDPQISPDGQTIVYVRSFKDIMTDKNRSNLWMIDASGQNHRPLTTGMENDRSPRWSPDGKQLLYVSAKEESNQMYLRWMDTGVEARISNLSSSPSGISWSPDGKWIAFTMFVAGKSPSLVSLPAKPKGAHWNAPPKYIEKMKFKADGSPSILPDGFRHVFLLSAEGGTPRQLTTGDYNYGSVAWSPDGKSILVSANLQRNWQYQPNDSEVHAIDLATGDLKTLTSRIGPDNTVGYSPSGKKIAYTGFDDKYLGLQLNQIYVMDSDGKNSKSLTAKLDRSVSNVIWSQDGKGLYFQYHDQGNSKVAYVDLNGTVSVLADNVGGLSLGRPYSGGQFTVSKNDVFAFTHSTPDHPADVAVGKRGGGVERLTRLNDDLFAYKKLGEVEEIRYKSSFDGQEIQGWICKPPNFDPTKKYPLILEIHGGPFTNYGDRFSAEVQLYAAAGYVVLYTNPRGSTSYGADFGNEIHHNYPSQDYDDLMSGVDAVIAKGYVDDENLFVTGGSGGGVLTSWIVGKTDRFRAAVVAKPVINWTSFVLHADNPAFFAKYWFGGMPWEEGMQEKYWARSPLSLVGNVVTPTMLLTGEQDYRTPMSETVQYYTALKLRKIQTALVRIQNSGHGIANTPSNLMSKVVYVLGWFEDYIAE